LTTLDVDDVSYYYDEREAMIETKEKHYWKMLELTVILRIMMINYQLMTKMIIIMMKMMMTNNLLISSMILMKKKFKMKMKTIIIKIKNNPTQIIKTITPMMTMMIL